MSNLEHLLVWLYNNLLRLFPSPFRNEFDAEMQVVFAATLRRAALAPGPAWRRKVAVLGLFIREVADLPAVIWSALQFRPTQVPGDPASPLPGAPSGVEKPRLTVEPSAWSEALLGAVPFILYGLAYFLIGLSELSGDLSPAHRFFQRYAPQAVYFLTGLGLVAGWAKGFPRWSYAFLGMFSHFALDLFNEHFSTSIFGGLSWVPPLAVLLIALVLSRSLRPLGQFVRGIWNDWTLLALPVFAALLPVYTILFFDMEWGWFELAGLAVETLLLAAGAVVFLRSRAAWQRVVSLQVPMLLLAASGVLWSGWNFPLALLLFALFWGGLALVSGLFGLAANFHRKVKANR